VRKKADSEKFWFDNRMTLNSLALNYIRRKQLMKKILFITSIALILGLAACKEQPTDEVGDAQDVATGSGTSYQLDTDKSKMAWTAAKITAAHNGTVKIKSGNVFASKDGTITGGKFTIDLTTITVKDLTGEMKEKLEGHLKTTDFFEVEKFPEGVFEITSVKPNEKDTTITGNLTLRDITKSVEFPATIVVENGKPVSAKANVKINRQNWGIVYKGKPDDLIKDTIELDLDLVTK
jgi:polyisoprenoid-binding protein YceI